MEEAGGKCLPCVVDIRYEDQVSKAVEQATEKFGGIDILVNNASAINLTGTLATDMKRYIQITIVLFNVYMFKSLVTECLVTILLFL